MGSPHLGKGLAGMGESSQLEADTVGVPLWDKDLVGMGVSSQ